MDSSSSDEEEVTFIFENGHWIWDHTEGGLKFVDLTILDDAETAPSQTRKEAVGFKEDIDVLTQVAYRKKYLRRLKPNEPSIVTLQDVKDVVIYTAPKYILSIEIIITLHSLCCDRLLRALIAYTQYFLQISRLMKQRAIEATIKIRTPASDEIEKNLSHNLKDLRILIGKEYSLLNYGVVQRRLKRKRPNHLLIERQFSEKFLRLCIQIVRVALSRVHADTIEFEINRIFRTARYSTTQIRSPEAATVLTPHERSVLYDEDHRRGSQRQGYKGLKALPPVCKDLIRYNGDFRLFGIGNIGIKRDETSCRAEYMEQLVCAPESKLPQLGIRLGILGQPKDNYDVMLFKIKDAKGTESIRKSRTQAVSYSARSSSSKSSRSTRRSSIVTTNKLSLPPDEPEKIVPEEFPKCFPKYKAEPPNAKQRRRWVKRYLKM